MTFKFEEKVIDVILNLIKKHQLYLTQPENLLQLAKLGYMYNSLWYSGRLCWGQNGKLSKSNKSYQCEDNPKYKIEMCEPQNEEIGDLIYDAWGLHVTDDMHPSWKEFSTIIRDGKVLSELELKKIKPKKTFDEWVELLTDPEHEYSSIYPDRKSVAHHLLCTIGNGYDYKDGFVIMTASGANEDHTIYGAWENAKFRDDINSVVENILNIKEVEQTLETAYLYIKKIKDLKAAKDLERDMKIFGMSYQEYAKKEAIEEAKNPNKEYHPYYPISEPYSEITRFDENTHPSYIKAGLEICEDILANKKKETKENVTFAKKYIKKFKN